MPDSNYKILLRWVFCMLGYVLIAFAVLVVAYEVYNPRANQLRVGEPNSHILVNNTLYQDLPSQLLLAYNNIGFVGADYNDTIQQSRVFFIGSSTTQNLHFPWLKTWIYTAMEGSDAWFNNAGIGGSAVNEWRQLVKSLKKYHPDFIVVLVSPFGEKDLEENALYSKLNLMVRIRKLKLLKQMVFPYYRSLLLGKKNIGHRSVNWSALPKDTLQINKFELYKVAGCTAALHALIQDIKQIGAIPILISQPTPYADYTESGIDVKYLPDAQFEYDLHRYFAGQLDSLCQANQVDFVDGFSLPPSLALYNDHTHFNTKGNLIFGHFIQKRLQGIIQKRANNE